MTAIKKECLAIKEERLANGLLLTFTDESNRYFGDYHHICVVATIFCNLYELPSENPDDETLRYQAIETFGEQLYVAKRLERMGVPTADVEKIRTSMIDDFLRHAVTYLARLEYPHSLVIAELSKRRARSGTHHFYG